MLILFCGAGALGSTAVTLCRTLPAKLSIVDFDRVESKNLLSQAFTRQAVGRNKAEALKLQLRTFYGVDATAYPVRLTADNVATVAAGADLLVDCFDNAASRLVVRSFAATAGVPSVHAGLAADGTFGLVRWGERFEPDDPGDTAEPGRTATCVDGEHLPFIGLVAARLATVVARFVRAGEKADSLITLS